jgi:hypothetical protein
MRGRVNGAGVLAVIGAAALLVGLFLNWFEPGVTAWNAFEIVDLLLAAIAVGVLIVALAASSDRPRLVALAGWLPIAAAVALVLVVVSLLNPPPTVGDGSPDIGALVSLAGAALLVVGAVLATTEFSLVITVRPRRGEMAAPAEDVVPPAADPGWEPPVPESQAETAFADTPLEEPFEEPLEAPPLEEPPPDEPVEEPATDEELVEPGEPTEIDEIIEPGEPDAETQALRPDERG